MDDKELAELREHYDVSLELVRGWGLEPYEVDFHVAPAHRIYEVASYGLPGHFSHWTYGRNFWLQKQSYDYGHSKIYELVINANPAQAFLLDTNSTLENMFVISHVCGHSDFFANNTYFAHTNRSIEASTSSTAERFRGYELAHGRYVVEEFIDDVMTISRHVSQSTRIKSKTSEYERAYGDDPYEDLFPESVEKREALRLQDKTRREKIFPYEPEEDLLLFIGQNAKLTDWQQDVILSMRQEALYFHPQLQTKVMNEGWASLIHRCCMHTLDPDVDPGGIEFASLHSGVLSHRPGRINPYWLGYSLFMRIIEKFGEHSHKEMANLDFIGGEGWKKALEIRFLDKDDTFVRNFLDQEICENLDLFEFAFNAPDKQWEVTEIDWELVRDTLVTNLSEAQSPQIEVIDSNGNNAGELVMMHMYDGRPLESRYLKGTLKSVEKLWGRPVALYTQADDKILCWTCREGEITSTDGSKNLNFEF